MGVAAGRSSWSRCARSTGSSSAAACGIAGRKSGQRGEVARAVEYLARYANRIAMSNSRLVAIEGQEVVFRYRDHRDGGTWRTTSLPGVEFLERFLWHLVPRGLRRIRRFGWWGNAVRTEKLALLRRLLGVPPAEPSDAAPPTQWEGEAEESPDPELRRLEEEQGTPRKCRVCGGKMELTVSDGASDGGRVAADAAEYGAAGGDRAAATAPARSPPFCDHPTRREETDSMPRLIFQRTAHLRRYRCAPTTRKTAHHDTLVSHQGLLDPLSHASGRAAHSGHRAASSPQRRHASDSPAATRYFLHSIWSSARPACSALLTQGSSLRGLGCSACGLVPCSLSSIRRSSHTRLRRP